MSRGDYRIQPGVSTPGPFPPSRTALKGRKIQILDLGHRPCPGNALSFTPSGWYSLWDLYPGLKPRAESYSPFGTRTLERVQTLRMPSALLATKRPW